MTQEETLIKIYTLVQILDELFTEVNPSFEKVIKEASGTRPNFFEIQYKLKSTLRLLEPFNKFNFYEVDEKNTQELSRAYEFIIETISSNNLENDIKIANFIAEELK